MVIACRAGALVSLLVFCVSAGGCSSGSKTTTSDAGSEAALAVDSGASPIDASTPDAPHAPSVPLDGSPDAPYPADASPARLFITPSVPQSFAATPGQPSSPISFVVQNGGEVDIGPLAVTFTGPDAADFVASTNCTYLEPLAACRVAVVWKPTQLGTKTASLVVAGPAPDFEAVSVTLIGLGCACPNPLSITPLSDNLGAAAVGTTGAAVTFTATLATSAAVEHGPFTVAVSNADFLVVAETCSTSIFAGMGACTISVAFRPTSPGPKTATLTVRSGDGLVAAKTLTGVGVEVDAGVEDGSSTDGTGVDGPAGPG